jgi:hypothetical protein
MSIVQHSAETNEHYTPHPIIAAAWRVMGRIDLDPATTESVNRCLVGAERFHTKETDGLARPWFGNVWLNPPGGLIDRKSSAAVWWDKLVTEYMEGRVKQALFMGFTLEIQRTTQDSPIWICDVPYCIPRERLDFYQETEEGGYRVGGAPAHGNIIAYLPPSPACDEREIRIHAFMNAYSAFGRVRR